MVVDLNALRKTIIENQKANVATPEDPAKVVVVDRNGVVKMGSDTAPGETTTQVPQETFARYGRGHQ